MFSKFTHLLGEQGRRSIFETPAPPGGCIQQGLARISTGYLGALKIFSSSTLQRQMDFCEFKASLAYLVSSRTELHSQLLSLQTNNLVLGLEVKGAYCSCRVSSQRPCRVTHNSVYRQRTLLLSLLASEKHIKQTKKLIILKLNIIYGLIPL